MLLIKRRNGSKHVSMIFGFLSFFVFKQAALDTNIAALVADKATVEYTG